MLLIITYYVVAVGECETAIEAKARSLLIFICRFDDPSFRPWDRRRRSRSRSRPVCLDHQSHH
jgi:hypothetical protein